MATDVETVIVTADRESTHSAVEISSVQAQKILPGISPLKAIETLPGVVYETADPWGNNEQNESLVVHGFTTQQLGYTMDGVPLGDQQYGNYNGLSPSRALTSENVRRVTPVIRHRLAGRGLHQQSGRRHRDLLQRSHWTTSASMCARPAAAMTPAAPSCASTPAIWAMAMRPMSPICTRISAPGISTATSVATS